LIRPRQQRRRNRETERCHGLLEATAYDERGGVAVEALTHLRLNSSLSEEDVN
jgi:hypothetical protein